MSMKELLRNLLWFSIFVWFVLLVYCFNMKNDIEVKRKFYELISLSPPVVSDNSSVNISDKNTYTLVQIPDPHENTQGTVLPVTDKLHRKLMVRQHKELLPLNQKGSYLFSSETKENDLILLNYLKHRIKKSKKSSNNLDYEEDTTYDDDEQTERDLISMIEKASGFKKNGFFIECGLNDADETLKSFHFQTNRNWTGLIIEPNGKKYAKLASSHPNAYLFKGCISPKIYPGIFPYAKYGSVGGLMDYFHKFKKQFISGRHRFNLTCIPLYSLILLMNVTTIDYLSITTGGSEVAILKTIPLRKIQIAMILLEWRSFENLEDYTIVNEAKKHLKMTELYDDGVIVGSWIVFKKK